MTNTSCPRKPYSADLWMSHKDNGNDDCLTGDDAETLAGAHAVLRSLKANPRFAGQWAYACIEGPDGRVYEELNPDYKLELEEVDEEYAMQQGMGLGIDAYNEAKGYR